MYTRPQLNGFLFVLIFMNKTKSVKLYFLNNCLLRTKFDKNNISHSSSQNTQSILLETVYHIVNTFNIYVTILFVLNVHDLGTDNCCGNINHHWRWCRFAVWRDSCLIDSWTWVLFVRGISSCLRPAFCERNKSPLCLSLSSSVHPTHYLCLSLSCPPLSLSLSWHNHTHTVERSLEESCSPDWPALTQ